MLKRKPWCWLILLALFTSSALAEDVTFIEKGPDQITDEPITLKVFASVKPNIEDMATNLQTLWYEEATGVHIEWEVPSSADLSTKLNLSLASGDYPDMYWGVSLTPTQTQMYAEQGILIPINDYLEEYAPDYLRALEEYPEIMQTVADPDGNVYSFARVDSGLHVRTSNKMFVYEPWLDALGMEIPETTEEFKQLLIAIRDNDLNGNGEADEIPLMGSTANSIISYLMGAFEVQSGTQKLNVKDGQVYASYMTEAYREGLRYIKSLYDEGLIARDTFVQDGTQLKAIVSRADEMLVGCAPGMYELSFADLNGLPTALTDFVAIPPLEGPDGTRLTAYSPMQVAGNAYITSSCEHPEIAVAWNNYWYTAEGMLVNLMGYDGVTYEWVDEPSIDGRTPSYRETTTIEGMQNIWWYASGPRLQTPELRYGQTGRETDLEYQLYTESLKYMDYFPDEYLPTTIWFTTDQANELSMLESTITSYVDEMATKFITGDRDIETDWESYLSELNAMQVDRVVEIYQEIYDSMH